MKSMDFIRAMGGIEDDMILETVSAMQGGAAGRAAHAHRRSFRRIIAAAAVLAALLALGAAAYATDFLGFREALVRQDSIGSIPDFKVTNADGTQNIKDMSQGARVSMTKPEAASDKLRPWVENLNAAVEEWNEYKNAARQSFINEKLPHLGKYTEPDVRMPEFTGNGDGTYTVKPIEDKLWSPGKDVEIVYADESEFFTVSEEEYNDFRLFNRTFFGTDYESAYDGYGVWSRGSEAQLEKIAGKYGLKLIKTDPEIYWDERAAAQGADKERCFSPAVLVSMLTERCCKGKFFAVTPTAFDKLYFINTGSFGLSCELPAPGGAELSVYIRNTVSDEFATGSEIESIIDDYTEYVTHMRTVPDGTEVYIAQGENDAYIYVYLDRSFLVMHVSVNPYGANPGLQLTEELTDYIADSFNYKELGK